MFIFANITKNRPISQTFPIFVSKEVEVKRFFLSLVIWLLSASLSFGLETPKTGWVFTPMPNLGYATDTGITLDWTIGMATAYVF